MLLKYHNQEIKSHCHFLKCTANGILESKYIVNTNNTEEIQINIPDGIEICLIGDGVVNDGKIRESLQINFGDGYFEEILRNAYLMRTIEENRKYFERYRSLFKTISNGISSILKSKIYPIKLTSEMIYIGDNIECYPEYHNEQNLSWYKSILDKSINQFDWIINFSNGIYEWNNADNIQNFVSDRIFINFRQLNQILEEKDSPLDLARHLEKYHCLLTSRLSKMNPHDFIKMIEIIECRLKYDEFTKQLANFINQQTTNLRDIPEEIELNDDFWFISLNWCNTDINSNKIRNLIKLHGSSQDYRSIVLPTQELRDNFIIDKNIGMVAFNLIKKCQVLYLWGISLSDYDVEIHYLISAGKNINKIIVINPDINVYHRVCSLVRIYELNNIKEIIDAYSMKK